MGLFDRMFGRHTSERADESALAVILVVGALLANLAMSGVAAAQANVDIDPFYDDLAAYGTWARSADYDWVWYPRDVPPGWQPYSDGRWVWTDDYGWYWESDRPWGWATFHYGRWFHDRVQGWGWVPGSVWGPAWVAWRSGGGYMGWAPLPPSARLSPGVDFDGDAGEYDVSIDPSDWLFVEERSFNAPRAYEVALAPSYNPWIVARTRPITHYGWHHHRFVNRGIPLARVEYATGARMPRARLRAGFVDHPRAFRDYDAARSGRFHREFDARTHFNRPHASAALEEPRRAYRGAYRSSGPRWQNEPAAARWQAPAASYRSAGMVPSFGTSRRRFVERSRIAPERHYHPGHVSERAHSRSERRDAPPSQRFHGRAARR